MICFLPKELLWPSLNIQKLKKEFWNRFKDHYDELKEIKEENNTYLFIGNNQNSIENQLKHIKHKLNKKYKKYIDDSNKDINKIKFKKNIDFPRHPKINIKLENINFFNDFQKLIKLEFPTGHIGKSMKDYLYDDLAKKYSININEEDKENNYFFSLGINFSYISFIENLDHNRLHRIYYFKFKKKYKNIREDQLEKMKLKILYKNKNFLILEDMDVIENRTNKIIKEILIDTDIKYNFDSDLVYQVNSELEIEQILVKAKKENLDAYNPPFFNHWVNAKRKKVKKIKNKELKKIDNFEQFSKHNSMHKLIIRTNKEGKINQSFKNKIYKLVTFDDIVNFEEAIYLSRKNIWSTPTEKHSFQFLIKDFSKYEKEINDLINQHKNSNNNAYKFLNKKDNDIEFEIIPIVNTLEHSDCSMECCSMECCSMNCCLMHDSSSQNLKY